MNVQDRRDAYDHMDLATIDALTPRFGANATSESE